MCGVWVMESRYMVGDVEKYLGRIVRDPYGRSIGHLVSFYSDSDGYVTGLEVSFGDTVFREIDIARFKLGSDGVVLEPEWLFLAKRVERKLEILRRRREAVEELYSKKEIQRHAYELFKKRFEDALVKAKEEARRVKTVLVKRKHELEDTIVELEKAISYIKISYIAGEISEKTYKTAVDQLRKHLESAMQEKSDVVKHLEKIEVLESKPLLSASHIHVEEKEQAIGEQPAPAAQQPVPVVVVDA